MARRAWLALAAGLALRAGSAFAVPSVPANFTVENAVPGTTFTNPTSIAFLPDGRMLVGEKAGTVWVVQNGVKLATPLWSRPQEVLDAVDRGFTDVAVDPNFASNRYVYFLYTVDPDSNGTDDNDDAFGRLTRYQVSSTNPNMVDPATRAILFGRIWPEGPLSASVTHTVGSLRWGTDGSLIVSVGEGAQFQSKDAGDQDPDAFLPGRTDPYENIGAFRAQYLGSLCGKILRLNPSNGHGYPSNPFYDSNPTSVQSRVWAYGVRNPFRIAVRPGSGSTNPADADPGSIYIGDVGWYKWEEFSIAKVAGRNFGWPCFEGTHVADEYPTAFPAHHGCWTIGTPENPSPHTPPVSDWHHSNPNQSSPSGIIGNAAASSAFYSGTSYPATYQGAYFFGDYGQSWIRVATLDANDNVIQFLPFGTAMDSPVDIVPDPISKDLFYVSISTGQVRRIRYTATPNNPPVAVASAVPTSGPAPLSVDFSSIGTTDPNGDPLTFVWNFADGNGSSLPNPTHVYQNEGTYNAVLTVNDGRGGVDDDQFTITVGAGNTAPTAIIASPEEGDFFAAGVPIPLLGDATDAEQAASALAYHWDVALHHNNHVHPGAHVSDLRNDSYVPEDHEDGTGTWLEVRLYVTDAGNLSDTASVMVYPEVDLEPSPVTVSPDPARRIDVNTFDFTLYNHGPMLSRKSRWQLVAGTTLLAEGDTLVGPLGSLPLSVPADVFLAPGSYDLRVVVDTFATVPETDETNNAETRTLDVVQGPVGVGPGADVLALSDAAPNPTAGVTTWSLQLPRPARVEFAVHDVQGREVWSESARQLGAGRWALKWDARGARSGVYLARVVVDGVVWVRRVAVLR